MRTVVPPVAAVALGAVFVVLLAAAAVSVRGPAAAVDAGYGTVQQVGRALFTTYALPFEAASILLVVGMISAVALGKRVPLVPAISEEPAEAGPREARR